MENQSSYIKYSPIIMMIILIFSFILITLTYANTGPQDQCYFKKVKEHYTIYGYDMSNPYILMIIVSLIYIQFLTTWFFGYYLPRSHTITEEKKNL